MLLFPDIHVETLAHIDNNFYMQPTSHRPEYRHPCSGGWWCMHLTHAGLSLYLHTSLHALVSCMYLITQASWSITEFSRTLRPSSHYYVFKLPSLPLIEWSPRGITRCREILWNSYHKLIISFCKCSHSVENYSGLALAYSTLMCVVKWSDLRSMPLLFLSLLTSSIHSKYLYQNHKIEPVPFR